jgi:hypothetical protein
MAKAAGNGYSPPPTATAPRFYSTDGNNNKIQCPKSIDYDKNLGLDRSLT